jgi:parvulin-like peptidyl-prolyl isomerase
LHVVDASDAPEGWLPEPVKGLQPGETSGVRSGEFGVYIARLEKVEAAHTLPFEEVQDRVRRILEQKREEELQAELLKRLREGATIEYSDAGAELMDLQGEPGSGE